MNKIGINFNLFDRFEFSKKIVVIVFLLLHILFAFLFFRKIEVDREKYYSSYLKLREMYFLINNAYVTKIPRDDLSIKKFLESAGYNTVSIKQSDDGFELAFQNIITERVVNLAYILENNGFEIVYFKATDNTGQGKYYVEVGIR